MSGLPAKREERTVLAELLLDLRQIRAADDADVDVLPQLQHERRHLLRHHLPWHARGDAESPPGPSCRREPERSGAERAQTLRGAVSVPSTSNSARTLPPSAMAALRPAASLPYWRVGALF